MADQEIVRKICLSLPATVETENHFGFSVNVRGKFKGIAWTWLERVHPKKGRVPNPAVLAIRVRDLEEKDMFLASDPEKFFTEPHYAGFPAILVRLAAIEEDELRYLLTNAWRCMAPPELILSGAVPAAPVSRRRKR